MHNLSTNIKTHRIRNQFTQDDIAQFLNVSKTSVSKWENNLATPDIYHLIQLSKLFNISIDQLVDHSPILSKQQVRKKYQDFLNAFQARQVDDVMDEVEATSHEYYNDFEFLLSLITLMFNHVQLGSDEDKERMLNLAESLIERISQYSEDTVIRVQTHFYKALLLDIRGDHEAVVQHLKESNQPALPAPIILAKNYVALGKTDEAEETLQIHLYQNIGSAFDTMINMIHFGRYKPGKLAELIERVECIAETFNFNTLNPSKMLNGYFVIAIKHAEQNDDDATIDYLKKSLVPIRNLFDDYSLHGDEFFDQIDGWIERLGLGQEAPTTREMAKGTIVNMLNEHSLFSRFQDNKDFQNILKQVEQIN